MLDRDQLRQDLHYDRATGFFFWKVDRRAVKAGDRAGTLTKAGYVMIKYRGKIYAAGRLAWFYETGAWPAPGRIIEHQYGNTYDNRWDRLISTTRQGNSQRAADRL